MTGVQTCALPIYAGGHLESKTFVNYLRRDFLPDFEWFVARQLGYLADAYDGWLEFNPGTGTEDRNGQIDPDEDSSGRAGGGLPQASSGPDGPFDPDGFRFAQVEVRFDRAALRRRLVLALWDTGQNQMASPRPTEDVISEVYESDDVEDATFRKLCSDTRQDLRKANCPLDIETKQGKVQLRRL